jgi:hypothetical protein
VPETARAEELEVAAFCAMARRLDALGHKLIKGIPLAWEI